MPLNTIMTVNSKTGKTDEAAITAKLNALPPGYLKNVQHNALAVTSTPLCPQVTVSGSFNSSNLFNSELWHYYTFSGNAGELVSLYAPRTGNCHMDPSFSLYFGTTNDNTGVSITNGGYNMQYLIYRDDQQPQICSPAGACYEDPVLTDYMLPYTGKYTIAVQNFLNCEGGPFTYDLSLTFNGSGNLYIGECNTGVPDTWIDCNRMSDAIAACAAGAANHGAFVSCVTQLANNWKTAGYITGAQKGAITACAAHANIP